MSGKAALLLTLGSHDIYLSDTPQITNFTIVTTLPITIPFLSDCMVNWNCHNLINNILDDMKSNHIINNETSYIQNFIKNFDKIYLDDIDDTFTKLQNKFDIRVNSHRIMECNKSMDNNEYKLCLNLMKILDQIYATLNPGG
jgi:hypothetical protein